MKKRILITFWVPEESLQAVGDDFEVVYPDKPVTGVFTMDQVKSMLPDFDAVLISGEKFTKDVIDLGLTGKLRVIARHGVGCDSVDCDYAGSKGVAVVNTPNAVTEPTAELAVAIMMDVARSVSRLDRRLRAEGACFFTSSFDGMSTGLYGKTLGIIGFGRIGKAVARKARGLGMKVIYSDVVAAPPEVEKELGAQRMDIKDVLRQADFVSVHCPYTPENHHLIKADTLALMKPSAYLVNASRGKMVDEQALVKALKDGVIKGAALDVFEYEPEVSEGLITMDNVVLVPHIGTCCYEARMDMTVEALAGVTGYLRGENPPNIFNRDCLVTG